MRIVIDGKTAVLKNGTSFDMVSENRAFSGADSYTLSIIFPLRGCPENIDIFGHLNRIDVDNSKVRFDCEIFDVDFYSCLLYTSPSPRDSTSSRMPSSA